MHLKKRETMASGTPSPSSPSSSRECHRRRMVSEWVSEWVFVCSVTFHWLDWPPPPLCNAIKRRTYRYYILRQRQRKRGEIELWQQWGMRAVRPKDDSQRRRISSNCGQGWPVDALSVRQQLSSREVKGMWQCGRERERELSGETLVGHQRWWPPPVPHQARSLFLPPFLTSDWRYVMAISQSLSEAQTLHQTRKQCTEAVFGKVPHCIAIKVHRIVWFHY